jgi:hypothetical protein
VAAPLEEEVPVAGEAPVVEGVPAAEEAPIEEEMVLAQATADPPMEARQGEKEKSAEDEAMARKTEYQYTASFLRDPFKSLVSGEEGTSNRLLEVSSASMVGSVWGESGIIALLEDDSGRSFALKVGDRVVNGRVVSVTPATVTFTITVFGLTRSVTLELAEEGEW